MAACKALRLLVLSKHATFIVRCYGSTSAIGKRTVAHLLPAEDFTIRHIGPDAKEQEAMLETLGCKVQYETLMIIFV